MGLKITCTIIVMDSGSIMIDFKGPVNGKAACLELLKQAMELVRQGDELAMAYGDRPDPENQPRCGACGAQGFDPVPRGRA